ncbi:MAG TPA: kynureninase [Cytophagaceae bacterium]
MINFENNLAFAQHLDKEDPLKEFKARFNFPTKNNKTLTYFCGNSLGLQPKSVKGKIDSYLSDWSNLGVEGHVKGQNPWVDFHKKFRRPLANLVGAEEDEVIAMNSLTVNLHLMLTTFYRPTNTRFKIITEAQNFSSDLYALESQVRLHGFDPNEAIVEVAPRAGSFIISHDDIIKEIEKAGDTLALVLFSGINYYTGQAFDIKEITNAAHKQGAKAGFDLAHAIGNIKMDLHRWNVDFAVWCSYKYLNSGPGGTGGLFVHNTYALSKDVPRLAGWFGHKEDERFLMKKGFIPEPGADGWQLSNAPVLSLTALSASLELFEEAGIDNLMRKSARLTSFLEYLITYSCTLKGNKGDSHYEIKIITPRDNKERGCQLSIHVANNGKLLYENLIYNGFVVDWRVPSVLRVAPVPLYNSFEEVYKLAMLLAETCCHG